ncbi:MAG: 4-(cytidine 5'-diphospho)-2-C-methyl-D-erythritol kinase [Cyanobacteria bacterium SIG30]|nr:4-(cytidine 5'-diphospho)-2-C-methyl-D-erythritol kinase [Cyanobacteria bacterium SIG30]
MKKVKISAPCKINLNLKIKGILENGFHEIESIMQTVDLFDYLTIEKCELDSLNNQKFNVFLDGTKKEILSYGESNIVYKASKLFFETTGIEASIKIFIEKNIPISAGLAGGSTDAAGVLYGLNELFNKPLNERDLLDLCEKLGSDLNFCLLGGRALVKGRGEVIEKLDFEPFNLTIVKPKNLSISAKEAYQKFDISKGVSNLDNDLEWALLPFYKELQYLNSLGLKMSGSGSAYFKIGDFDYEFNSSFEVFKNLNAIPDGVSLIECL